MNVDNTLEKFDAVVLAFWVVVVWLEFDTCQQAVLEGFKSRARQDQCPDKVVLVIIVRTVFLGIVHVPQHLQCTRSHGYAYAVH